VRGGRLGEPQHGQPDGGDEQADPLPAAELEAEEPLREDRQEHQSAGDHGLYVVDALVSDVVGEPGGLPLLSTTLLELWRARDGGALRYDSYRTSGGVRGAVARLAEAAYRRLSEREQRNARSVMLRLAGGEGDALVRRRVPLAELEQIDGASRVVAELTDARLLTISDDEVEISHEAVLREWPRYRTCLEEDRAGRRMHAHLISSAREWDAAGRDSGELYRGARLTGALDWAAQHDDRLNALEREFIQASRIEAERQNRRLRILLLGVAGLLMIAVVAAVIAFIKQQTASNEARVALAQQLGAQAVNEPRIDLAMLLAREAVNLDRSPQTEGSLLATLLRSPAAIGTFALPVSSAWRLTTSPDGRTLAASALFGGGYFAGPGTVHGEVRFYNGRPHAVLRPALTDFGGAQPVYSSDGSLLAYPTQDYPESIAVRDAHTFALRAKLVFDPFQIALYTPDLAHATILISPDGRSVYCAYRVFDSAHKLLAAYVDHWSLPSGRRLSTTRIGGGRLLSIGLIDRGARLAVVGARTIRTFAANSLQPVSSVSITPAPPAPSTAAVSPDGRQIAIGSSSGRVSVVR
jgi:Novel STAND NTPase 1